MIKCQTPKIKTGYKYKVQIAGFRYEWREVCLNLDMFALHTYYTYIHIHTLSAFLFTVLIWVKTFQSRAPLRQFRVNFFILLQQLHSYTTLCIPHVW